MIRYVAFGLIAALTTASAITAYAQVSQEQKDHYQKLVDQLIAYRKLSHCGVASFEAERKLPKINIKRARESANVGLMKNIDEYIKNYSPKPQSQTAQARFRHDMYLEITSSAESEVRKFVIAEVKTNDCKEVLTQAGQ